LGAFPPAPPCEPPKPGGSCAMPGRCGASSVLCPQVEPTLRRGRDASLPATRRAASAFSASGSAATDLPCCHSRTTCSFHRLLAQPSSPGCRQPRQALHVFQVEAASTTRQSSRRVPLLPQCQQFSATGDGSVELLPLFLLPGQPTQRIQALRSEYRRCRAPALAPSERP